MSPEPSDEGERCALVWGSSTESRDCNVKASCGICYLHNNTRIMMKGLCKRNTHIDNDYDIHYFSKGQKNGK